MRLSILLLLLLTNMVIGHAIQNNIIDDTEDKRTSDPNLAKNSEDILETAEKVTGVISHQKKDYNNIVKRLYDEGYYYQFTNYPTEYTNEDNKEEERDNNVIIDVLLVIGGLIYTFFLCFCHKFENKDVNIDSSTDNSSVTVPATVYNHHQPRNNLLATTNSTVNNNNRPRNYPLITFNSTVNNNNNRPRTYPLITFNSTTNNNNRPRNNPLVTVNSTRNNNNRSYNRDNYDDDDILPEYKEVDITSSIPTIINSPSTSSSSCTTTETADVFSSENNNYHLPTYEECMTNSND